MTKFLARLLATLAAVSKYATSIAARTPVGTLLELGGMAAVAAGVALIYLPAGLIVLGILMAVVGIASDR